MNLKIKVVAGIIFRDDGRFLIGRKKTGKSFAGYWEFPGGKIEKEEDPAYTLQRELIEELGIYISQPVLYHYNEYQQEENTIALSSYKANYLSGEITLTDHDKIEWVNIFETDPFLFAPADVPILNKLKAEKFSK